MHHCEITAHMRMRIALARSAVRSPTRMRNSERTFDVRSLGALIELRDSPRGAQPLQTFVDDRKSGRVVASIFESPQSLDQHRDDVAFGCCADDSAHVLVPRLANNGRRPPTESRGRKTF